MRCLYARGGFSNQSSSRAERTRVLFSALFCISTITPGLDLQGGQAGKIGGPGKEQVVIANESGSNWLGVHMCCVVQ